jgi:hypothetical protein
MSCSCPAAPQWDDQAASFVCPDCAQLLNTDILLVDQDDTPARPQERTRPSWHLAGQEKDARNRKNEVAFRSKLYRVAHLSLPSMSSLN